MAVPPMKNTKILYLTYEGLKLSLPTGWLINRLSDIFTTLKFYYLTYEGLLLNENIHAGVLGAYYLT